MSKADELKEVASALVYQRTVGVDNRLAELEKENAELKEKLKPENCLKLLAKEGYIKFTSDQLTKAKELINLFIQWNYGCCKTPDFKDLVKQAEQFLKKIK